MWHAGPEPQCTRGAVETRPGTGSARTRGPSAFCFVTQITMPKAPVKKSLRPNNFYAPQAPLPLATFREMQSVMLAGMTGTQRAKWMSWQAAVAAQTLTGSQALARHRYAHPSVISPGSVPILQAPTTPRRPLRTSSSSSSSSTRGSAAQRRPKRKAAGPARFKVSVLPWR